MLVKKIELKHFRNYENLTLDFNAQKTLIIGQNAQGKTNLLEAIYYLSALNSNRIKKDSELIFFKENAAQIKGEIFKNDTEIELEVLINPPKNKIYKVNGLKKTKTSEFIRVLSVVSFSVGDLLLLRGEPSFRRKWLDLAICQVYPVYSEKIAKYNKIRLQKANLLANYPINPDMLDVFNCQLSYSGANIIFLRSKFLKELEKIAVLKHSKIAQNELLSLEYDCEFTGGNQTVEEIEAAFSLRLNEVKEDEIRRAQCLVGPHRDDILFFINGIDAKKFASQGQQRTIVLALKLSELQITGEKNNETPVLLLDDVLAELDEVRQNYLLGGIDEGIQTIITCTDTKAFSEKFLDGIQIVKINNGAIF